MKQQPVGVGGLQFLANDSATFCGFTCQWICGELNSIKNWSRCCKNRALFLQQKGQITCFLKKTVLLVDRWMKSKIILKSLKSHLGVFLVRFNNKILTRIELNQPLSQWGFRFKLLQRTYSPILWLNLFIFTTAFRSAIIDCAYKLSS